MLGWDERMQVGAEGLHAAVMRFNLKRPERFAGQFAEKYIRGFLQDAKRAARKDGMQDVPDQRSKGGEVWVVNLRTEYDEILAVGDAEDDGDNARALSSARRIVGEASRSGRAQISNPFLAERLHLVNLEVRILKGAGLDNVARHDLPFALERMADSGGGTGRRVVSTNHLYPPELGKVYPAQQPEPVPVRNVGALRTALRAVWATRFELVRKSKERRLRAPRKPWAAGNPWTVEVYAAGPGEIRAGENRVMWNWRDDEWKIGGWRAQQNARIKERRGAPVDPDRRHVPDSYVHAAAKRKARLELDWQTYELEMAAGARLIPQPQQASL